MSVKLYIDSVVIESSTNRTGVWTARAVYPDDTYHEYHDVIWGATNTKLVLDAIAKVLIYVPDSIPDVVVYTVDANVSRYLTRSHRWAETNPQRVVVNRTDADYWIRMNEAKRTHQIECVIVPGIVDSELFSKAVNYAKKAVIAAINNNKQWSLLKSR